MAPGGAVAATAAVGYDWADLPVPMPTSDPQWLKAQVFGRDLSNF